MSEDKKNVLTDDELKKATGGTDRTGVTQTGPSRGKPQPSEPGTILDPLGGHDQATPESRDQADPTQQP